MRTCLFLFCLVTILPAVAASAAHPPGLDLIPWPKSLEPGSGNMGIASSSRIVASSAQLKPLAQILSDEIYLATGLRLAAAEGAAKAGDIVLRINPALKADRDILTVQNQKVLRTRNYAHTVTVGDQAVVEGFDYRAVAEGTATLLQALRSEKGSLRLPKMTVKDWPQADFMAAMVDVGRQDIPIDALKQVVQACRVYKVRYLQLHLTDDQGWTFPSKAYPKLGTKNQAAHGGIPPRVYDLEELKGLVAFADARGVTIVPELETPGHSSAARRAMPEPFASIDAGGKPIDLPMLNIGNEKMYAALDTIVGEMCDVFKSTPYFHIGADETIMGNIAELPESKALMAKQALKGAGDLFHYFIRQMNQMVRKRGKVTIIWEGGGLGASKDIIVMTWSGGARTAERLVAEGITTITVPWGLGVPWPEWNMYICNGSYLKRTDPVIGAMLPMWEMSAENLINGYIPGIPKRQERTWGPDNTFTEEEFNHRCQSTEALVAKLILPVQIKAAGLFDIDAKAPTDKGNMFNGSLTVTLESTLKDGTIRYGLDGTEPTASSTAYTTPIKLTKDTTVKAGLFAPDGKIIGYVNTRTFQYVNYEANLTTGKPVTVSGGTQAENKPEYAVDGLVFRDRAWWAAPGPQWLMVDLQNVHTLNEAAVFPYWDGQRYYQYTLELSTDGKNWTQVVDMSQNTKPSTAEGFTHTFKPTPARYVRINMLKGSAWPQANPVHLVELRVYQAK